MAAKSGVRGAYNIFDLRDMAKRRLPRGMFEFIDRGVEDEVALRANRAAFEAIKLKPRMLTNIAKRDLTMDLFGERQDLPLIIAPTGTIALAWFEGDIALARAARAAGIPFTIATPSLVSMERVQAEAGGRLWFQLYPWEHVGTIEKMLERVKAVGFEALVVTVDSKISSKREYNYRNGFDVPLKLKPRNVIDVALHPGWFFSVLARYYLTTGAPKLQNLPAPSHNSVFRASGNRVPAQSGGFDLDKLKEVRRQWPNKLIVKGILTAEDAMLARDCGADGVVVSNHGGRALDSAPTSIAALPPIVDAVGGRMTVIVDSGIRRGSDVVKALALGADAVQVGRAALYGLSAAGEAGVTRAIDILAEEIDRVMGQTGCASIADIDRDLIF